MENWNSASRARLALVILAVVQLSLTLSHLASTRFCNSIVSTDPHDPTDETQGFGNIDRRKFAEIKIGSSLAPSVRFDDSGWQLPPSADISAIIPISDTRIVTLSDRLSYSFVSNATTGEQLFSCGGVRKPTCIGISPEEDYLLIGSDRGTVRVVETKSLLLVREIPVDYDNRILAASLSRNGELIVYDGRNLRSVNLHSKRQESCVLPLMFPVSLASSGSLFAGVDGETRRTVSVWNTDTKACTARLFFDEDVTSIALSSRGTFLATGCESGTTLLWDLSKKRQIRIPQHEIQSQLVPESPPIADSEHSISALAFSRNDRILATTGSDGCIRLWNTGNGDQLDSIFLEGKPAISIALSSDGSFILAGDTNRTVRIWHSWPSELEARPSRRVNQVGFQELWKMLLKSGPEDYLAYDAMRSLMSDPSRTLACLPTVIHPVPADDTRLVDLLVCNLSSDNLAIRNRAELDLQRLGIVSAYPLQNLRAGQPSLELARRIESILTVLKTTPEIHQQERAIQLLEHIASAEAIRLLRLIAEDRSTVFLSRKAQEALQRIEKSP